MAFKFLVVPIQNCEAAEAELNAFLRSHKVLSVRRRWVDQGTTSFWSFCIDYLEAGPGTGKGSRPSGQRTRVDYRDVLKHEDFVVFARLREVRKQIAQAEGTPVYAVFNNEQLAQMVQKRAATNADLETIVGVGDARVGKYGARVLEFLRQQWDQGDEAGGKPV